MPFRDLPSLDPAFIAPPLDGTVLIPAIYDFHYTHNPDYPLFKYDKEGVVSTITWKVATEAIYTAARILTSQLQVSPATRPVVAILAVIDQLSYFALSAGIMRAGCQAFPISPRNSDEGTANMMQQMGVRYMFVSGDRAMQGLAGRACEKLDHEVKLLSIPTFRELYEHTDHINSEPNLPSIETGPDDIAMILHSSGSTSFPKPISLTTRNLLQWGMQPYYGDMEICGKTLSNHSLPFFHAMGVVSLQWATMTGVILSNFEPSEPPILSTPDVLYSSALGTGSTLIFCVPSFVEEWSQNPERVAELMKFDGVMFGGAPIQKSVGDKLVEAGVKLYPFYGATEIGGTSKFVPSRPPEEGWEYFEISGHCNSFLVEQAGEENLFQLVFSECPTHSLAVCNTTAGNGKGYDSNDLVIRHPLNPKLMKIYGRADDQIMHSTGEKTNPVPIETLINRSPAVHCGLVFGRGRFQAGILIEPHPNYVFNPEDLDQLYSFRDAIWPTVEEANAIAPSHSRIFKEMILVSSPSKPFAFTAKGTPRRHIILADYANEIDAAYAHLEESSGEDIPLSHLSSKTESLYFVRTVVTKVMRRTPADDDDLFQNGCDSLQATWIRNTLLRSLSTVNIPIKLVPVNFVYLHPSIRRLAKYITDLVNHSSDSLAQRAEDTISEMEAMVEKYSQDYPMHGPSLESGTLEYSNRESVLLTGSTGSLGSYILERLLLDDAIHKVYALNRKDRRPSIRSIEERQKDAFVERGLNVDLLESPKLIFVEGDTGSIHSLRAELLNDMRKDITCIIHNAWRVDFNVALSSMEPLVSGTRRLIDFALESVRAKPPSILFVSSIGVARNYPHGLVSEEPLLDPAFAIGSGYPESKWVAERVLHKAAESTPLKTTIVRIGQMSGSYVNGCWNAHEWVPSIVKSGITLGCLPESDGVVSWIPVDVAASAIKEMALINPPATGESARYLHIVHPHPVQWNDIMKIISLKVGARLVPYSTWLGRLQESSNTSNEESENANPALRLLDFYQSASEKPLLSADAEAFGFPRLATVDTLQVAPSMRVVKPSGGGGGRGGVGGGGGALRVLGGADVDGWLAYWKAVGFL
ncbi:Adenylate-forming Reductase [Pleurotus pulmonarius]